MAAVFVSPRQIARGSAYTVPGVTWLSGNAHRPAAAWASSAYFKGDLQRGQRGPNKGYQSGHQGNIRENRNSLYNLCPEVNLVFPFCPASESGVEAVVRKRPRHVLGPI